MKPIDEKKKKAAIKAEKERQRQLAAYRADVEERTEGPYGASDIEFLLSEIDRRTDYAKKVRNQRNQLRHLGKQQYHLGCLLRDTRRAKNDMTRRWYKEARIVEEMKATVAGLEAKLKKSEEKRKSERRLFISQLPTAKDLRDLFGWRKRTNIND
jgi:hypothetical protein